VDEYTFENPDGEDPECDEEGEDADTGDGQTEVAAAAGEIITIDRDGCIVSIKTYLEPGGYELQVSDDQVNIDTMTKSVSAAGEYGFTWEVDNPAMEGAAGGAVGLDEEGDTATRDYVDYIDPYEYPREVANKCGGVEPDNDDDSTLGLGKGGPADPNDPEIFGEDPDTMSDNVEPVVVKSDVSEVEGDVLPATATPVYNVMLYGLGVLLLGSITLFIFRKRKV